MLLYWCGPSRSAYLPACQLQQAAAAAGVDALARRASGPRACRACFNACRVRRAEPQAGEMDADDRHNIVSTVARRVLMDPPAAAAEVWTPAPKRQASASTSTYDKLRRLCSNHVLATPQAGGGELVNADQHLPEALPLPGVAGDDHAPSSSWVAGGTSKMTEQRFTTVQNILDGARGDERDPRGNRRCRRTRR